MSLLHTLKSDFDPSIRYFDNHFYQKADDAFRTCKHTIYSPEKADQKCSILATNVIVYVLTNLFEKVNREDLTSQEKKEIFKSSISTSVANDNTMEKAKKIRELLNSLSKTTIADNKKEIVKEIMELNQFTKEIDETKIEWINRSYNMLRSHFQKENTYLNTLMDKPNYLTTKDLVLSCDLTTRPGSLAWVIGCEAKRLFEERFSTK